MLTALVLICSVAVTPDLRDCSRSNAVAVMRVPAMVPEGCTGKPARLEIVFRSHTSAGAMPFMMVSCATWSQSRSWCRLWWCRSWR